MLGKLQQFLLPQVVAAPSRLQFVNVASIRACECVSMPSAFPFAFLLLHSLLLQQSCHSLRAVARPRGHSALPWPSARLAAINRSVLINLLIIDAIMCFICGTTRANVRRPNCRLGSHQASEKHLDNVVSIVDPLLLHLLVWLNVFCCGCAALSRSCVQEEIKRNDNLFMLPELWQIEVGYVYNVAVSGAIASAFASATPSVCSSASIAIFIHIVSTGVSIAPAGSTFCWPCKLICHLCLATVARCQLQNSSCPSGKYVNHMTGTCNTVAHTI